MTRVDTSASAPSVDLSRLPAPAFVASLSFEEMLDARLTDFRSRAPDHDALLESDPALKLLETGAYRELLTRAAVNDAGRATMLAHAIGADLDNLALLYGIERLVVAPATASESAVLEPDEDLRLRIRLAPDRFAAGGLTAGGYRSIALRADPTIADVGLVKRRGGQIDVILLGRDGAVSSDTVSRVAAAFGADDVAGLTDIIAVAPASIVRWSAAITLYVRPGPDPALVKAAAERGVRAYAAARAKIGLPVYATMITSSAAVGGVEQAIVDIGDIDPGPRAAALLDALTIAVEVIR